jgi:hypothetical protein
MVKPFMYTHTENKTTSGISGYFMIMKSINSVLRRISNQTFIFYIIVVQCLLLVRSSGHVMVFDAMGSMKQCCEDRLPPNALRTMNIAWIMW